MSTIEQNAQRLNVTHSPKITIVTPSFNQGEFLEDTILSILDQGYQNLEYIVIDGGSSDNSIEIIRKYAEELTYWVSEPDRGQSHAINKGLQLASGEILTWINSDDILMPGALDAVADSFSRNRDAGFIYGDCLILNEDGNSIYANRVSSYDWGVLLYARSLINQPASFFRNDVLDKIGFLDEKLDYCLDLEFWARAAHSGIKFHMLPRLLAGFRLHRLSKTTSLRGKMLQEHLQILKEFSRFHKLFEGAMAGSLQFCFNFYHHARGVKHRVIERGDFKILRALYTRLLLENNIDS